MNSQFQRQRSGSVFILTLWSLFFLGALAVAVGAHVSANLRLAGEIRARTTARYLARAGVERAIHEITCNVTNWDAVTDEEMYSDEALFREVPLGQGNYSVIYTYVSTNTGETVTNFGVRGEARQLNVNRILALGTQTRLTSLIQDVGLETSVTASEITAAVKDYWTGKKDKMLTGGVKISYKGVIQSLCELRLVDALKERGDLLAELDPYLTLYDSGCFSGRAIGAIEGSGVESWVDFVCDRKGVVLYWYEH